MPNEISDSKSLPQLKEKLERLRAVKKQYDAVMNKPHFKGFTGSELVNTYGNVNPKKLGVELSRKLRQIKEMSNINEEIAELRRKIDPPLLTRIFKSLNKIFCMNKN